MRWITKLVACLTAAAIALPSLAQTPSIALPNPRAQTEGPALPPPTPVAGRPQLTAVDVEPWADGLMPYALQRGDVAGAVVVVVKDGQILFQKGYGYADVKAKTPVDPKLTLFRPGSVSKLFTWTAVMQLVEQGKLDLDADVNQYIDFKIPARKGKPVTLRNIMTHTAGFEEQIKGLISTGTPTPLGQHLKSWIPRRVFDAGTTPAYSNYATALAGYIVERVSGEPCDVYIQRHILTPLGMNHSSFSQPLPKALQPLMSKGYPTASGEAKEYETISLYPAGSLAAPGEDMGKFMIAHLNKGQGLLRPETAQMMHTTANTVIPGVNRMLLGFYEQNRNGQRVIGHGGDSQWFHTNLHLFLDQNVGLYISMNSSGKAGAVGPIRNAFYESFTNRYFPATDPQPKSLDLATAKQHAALMAGLYDNSRGAYSSFISALGLISQTRVIDNKDGTISVKGLNGLNDLPKKWREVSPFVWQELNGDARLAAEVKDGKVVRFTGDEIAPFMIFHRTGFAKSTAWLLPAVMAALAALALTGLLWPVIAIVRRKYGGKFALQGRSAQAYRLVRVFSLLAVAALIGWGALISAMFSDFSMLSPKSDPLIWLLNILALVALVGGTAIAGWNAYLIWTAKAPGRGWFAKAWSVIVLLSFLVLLYVAFAYKLIGFSTNY